MRGLFVTGTDTGVGKTVLSAALVASIAAAGEPVLAHKPAVTGLGEGEPGWPPDHELLATISGARAERVAPLRYAPAASPQLAAEIAGEQIEPASLVASVPLHASHTLIVEGVGGLLTPFADGFAVRELAGALGLPIVIAARAGLGTINHTLLTLEAARAAKLDVRAVVLTPWPAQPSRLERSNRETIARVGAVAVSGLPSVRAPERELLAAAGAKLPWREWLARCPGEVVERSAPRADVGARLRGSNGDARLARSSAG
jgi:dethiobiotin synthetase